jgi:hypothetical protein
MLISGILYPTIPEHEIRTGRAESRSQKIFQSGNLAAKLARRLAEKQYSN